MYHKKLKNYECWALNRPQWIDNKLVTKYHREDGPARITKENGTIKYQWFRNGKLERHDGPPIVIHNASTGELVSWDWSNEIIDANSWMLKNGIKFKDNFCTLDEDDALLFALKFFGS